MGWGLNTTKKKGYALSTDCSLRTLQTSPETLPQRKQAKNAIILTVSGVCSWQLSVCLCQEGRRKQNPEMYSKPSVNYGKSSEMPKGVPSRNSAHPPWECRLHKSLWVGIWNPPLLIKKKKTTKSQTHRVEYKKRDGTLFTQTNFVLATSSKQASNLCLNICLCGGKKKVGIGLGTINLKHRPPNFNLHTLQNRIH